MIDVRPLGPHLLDDYLDFFDNRAFADNPRWASCYCNLFYIDPADKAWRDYTGDENRAAVADRITRGQMPGYLAFDGDTAIGWCSAAPMAMVPAFTGDAIADKDRVGAIMCFLVDAGYRHRGIARHLLRAACAGFRHEGLAFAEGNPNPEATTEAANHRGPLELYLSEGFTHHRDDPDDGSVYVRKRLDGSAQPGEALIT